jgi:hypothetical protein
MSARIESKRMTNHNTPQLSRMDLANHCAVSPGLSLLNTRAVQWVLLSSLGIKTYTRVWQTNGVFASCCACDIETMDPLSVE